MNKYYLCNTYDTAVFRERKWEGIFVEFLRATKRDTETSRHEPLPIWPSFPILVIYKCIYIYMYVYVYIYYIYIYIYTGSLFC